MKANEAPEKLWIDPASDLPKLNGHIDKDSVEYIRKDAFIEKVEKWFDEHLINYWGTEAVDNGMMLDDFKKAMKL